MDDEIKVYMNTWKNYNEYGADLVLYDNINGWMDIDEAREFAEEHAEDEPFINDVDNSPIEVSEYDDVESTLDILERLQDFDEEERAIFGALVDDLGYNYDDATEKIENRDYSIYTDVWSDEDLGRSVVDALGGIEEISHPEYYIDENAIRRALEGEVRDYLYSEYDKDEIMEDNDLEDVDDITDSMIDEWVDNHFDDALDDFTEQFMWDVENHEREMEDWFFDFEKLGRDLRIEGTYIDLGAGKVVEIY